MIDLPYPRGEIAGLLEGLWKRDGIGHLVTEMPIEIIDLDAVRTQPCHHGGSCRVAQGELVVGSLKPNTAGR